MVGFRPAWFVHVNPETHFPRWVKTIDLSKSGQLIGPLEDKHAAARLIELAENAFDLCRYYNILVQAPTANACAYKEMGKCPAPCDGSISMYQYRRMIEWSAQTVVDPQPMLDDQKSRMHAAAGELRFEVAAKIKAFVDELSQLGKGDFRHVRRLEDFRYLSLQRGPRAGTAKLFLITPGRIEEIADLIDESADASELLHYVFALSAKHPSAPLDATGAERVGIVSNHLFVAKAAHGVFLPIDALDEKSLAKSFRDLQKQKTQSPDEFEGEGVLKELQAI
jgi:excinuclease UvrABC nuclease subunit